MEMRMGMEGQGRGTDPVEGLALYFKSNGKSTRIFSGG